MKISEEVRQAILSEPDGMSHSAVARKHGVTYWFAMTIRSKAGKHGASLAPQKKKKKPSGAIEKYVPQEVIEVTTVSHYDRVIEEIDQQIAIYGQTREVLMGLRALAAGS